MADYKIVNGICRPETPEALVHYKGMQMEINRFYDDQNKKLIRVGGRIGNVTRRGVNAVLGTSFKNCSEVADRAAALHGQLRSLADRNELAIIAEPLTIFLDIVDPPVRYDLDTGKIVDQNWKTAGVGGIPFWAMLLLGGGSYYYLYGGGKKKKKRKSLKGRS